MNFLACDLGGTKVLLGIFKKEINNSSLKLIFKKKNISRKECILLPFKTLKKIVSD